MEWSEEATFSTDRVVDSLTLDTNSVLTVDADMTLHVRGDLSIESSQVVIAPGAQLDLYVDGAVFIGWSAEVGERRTRGPSGCTSRGRVRSRSRRTPGCTLGSFTSRRPCGSMAATCTARRSAQRRRSSGAAASTETPRSSATDSAAPRYSSRKSRNQGIAASRSLITGSGSGHAMSRSGSSHRTPRARSGV